MLVALVERVESLFVVPLLGSRRRVGSSTSFLRGDVTEARHDSGTLCSELPALPAWEAFRGNAPTQRMASSWLFSKRPRDIWRWRRPGACVRAESKGAPTNISSRLGTRQAAGIHPAGLSPKKSLASEERERCTGSAGTFFACDCGLLVLRGLRALRGESSCEDRWEVQEKLRSSTWELCREGASRHASLLRTSPASAHKFVLGAAHDAPCEKARCRGDRGGLHVPGAAWKLRASGGCGTL